MAFSSKHNDDVHSWAPDLQSIWTYASFRDKHCLTGAFPFLKCSCWNGIAQQETLKKIKTTTWKTNKQIKEWKKKNIWGNIIHIPCEVTISERQQEPSFKKIFSKM